MWVRLARIAVGVGVALLGSVAIANTPAHAADVWQPKTPPLSTRWTQLVGPNNALAEYPRPQLSRTKWLNLNGLWGYAGRPAKAAVAAPSESDYREQILVPFPTESALSGVQRHDDQMWYRKVFEVPGDWDNQHVLLHFGAVDQIATVW
ncbi:MAG TPA: glycoside hydrolase family 2, partial [Mycobacterium sp.]